jgi:uncharacterized protein with HEPN domain
MKEPLLYLQDILESIDRIEEYTKKPGKKVFFESSEKQDAVLRRLEIIGEAIKNVPEDIKAANPLIPWKKIAGLRDVLIHSYSGVNLERVWKIVEDDLPKLKKDLKEVVKALKKDK